jgi:Type VI secretion system VasI, EvfG, VC_A0118
MRALLIVALAATLVGCSYPLRPQAGTDADPNGLACFGRTAESQLIEPKPASFKTNSATTEINSTFTAKTERPSSAYARDRAHLATAKPVMIAAKVEPSASRIPLSPRSLKTRLQPASNAGADSDTTRENTTDSRAATTVAERMTVGAVVAHKDRPNHLETALPGDAEKVAPESPNEPPTRSAQNQPADTVWVVSETTSPVDYSPLITAVIHSTSSVWDAPNTLAVRCRGPRTELLLRTEGAWRASRASEVQVDYQINDQPFVRLQWTVSADGKTASYKDDAVGLLQSLPEGARLTINVLDRASPGHEATFQLAGLDSVRKKIAVPCKWATGADKTSSGKR